MDHQCDWHPYVLGKGGLVGYLECAACHARRQPTTVEVRMYNTGYWQGRDN